jgi:wyosine [tRNA(Phe)-imidazoG37] synthetase (radical SAM superfamily)
MVSLVPAEMSAAANVIAPKGPETAFGCARDFLDNRLVYLVVSPRARGLSIGVNLNPDKKCNFDCCYCEVNRSIPSMQAELDIERMQQELERTMTFVLAGRLRERPQYKTLPEDLLRLRHVALSGDGEPSLAPRFPDALETLVHMRARGRFPFFKLVVITNASGFDRPEVLKSLDLLTPQDEIWAKLDAGTDEYLAVVNSADRPLQTILSNILLVAKERPVIIQSLFPSISSTEPSAAEIEAYVGRLQQLQRGGALISLVQIYSATRPTARSRIAHLPLRQLSRIAQRVREATGLRAEVF